MMANLHERSFSSPVIHSSTTSTNTIKEEMSRYNDHHHDQCNNQHHTPQNNPQHEDDPSPEYQSCPTKNYEKESQKASVGFRGCQGVSRPVSSKSLSTGLSSGPHASSVEFYPVRRSTQPSTGEYYHDIAFKMPDHKNSSSRSLHAIGMHAVNDQKSRVWELTHHSGSKSASAHAYHQLGPIRVIFIVACLLLQYAIFVWTNGSIYAFIFPLGALSMGCFGYVIYASKKVKTTDVYAFDRSVFDAYAWSGASQQIRRIWMFLMEKADTRNMVLFLLINLLFMVVEVVVGLWSNSLGLLSDAGHMFFDNAALVIGIAASYMSHWKSDEYYTYGYDRFSVLSGYTNAILLIFVGLSILVEALERLLDPPTVSTDHLLITSVFGLLVNLVGLFFFHDFSHGGGCSHGHGGGHHHISPLQHNHDHHHTHHHHHHHGHLNENSSTCGATQSNSCHQPSHPDNLNGKKSREDDNMYGVYLHVLADTLGSVGVIISSLLIESFGWHGADPICSLFIALLILGSVVPLLQQTGAQLLQRIPPELEGPIAQCLTTTRNLPTVLHVHKAHFWKQASKVYVGSVHVTVHNQADEQEVLQNIYKLFHEQGGVTHFTVQIEKSAFLQRQQQ